MEVKAVIDRIKKYKNISTKQAVADLLGISSGDFANREKRGTLLPVLVKWGVNESVSLDWLIWGAGDPAYKLHDSRLVDRDEFAYVPRVDIALSAGGGMEVLDERVTERLSFNKVWLKKVATATRNLVLMDVSGESMEPILSDGDMVLVDQGRTRIAAGKIYAVNLGDNLVAVKRLESRGKTVMVISENKAHEAFSVAGKDLKIIGQVIWYCRQLVPLKENNNG